MSEHIANIKITLRGDLYNAEAEEFGLIVGEGHTAAEAVRRLFDMVIEGRLSSLREPSVTAVG